MAQHSINCTANKKDAVNFARQFYDKNTLNSYYKVGTSEEVKSKLVSKTSEIKFSMDNMIKNRINHPEVNFYDYQKINEIISNPDEIKISKTKKNSILLLKKYNKKYQLVIKTTNDKLENFVTYFRYAEH